MSDAKPLVKCRPTHEGSQLRKEQIGNCVLYCGDMREIVPLLGAVHACVTDPPYHLQTIHKRFAKVGRNDKTWSRSGPHQRTASGFMNQQWDGGDVAFRKETWELISKVLKPGAHLVAFSGTRTYHRMACAIEDAGFEVRDMLSWLYGSGFPKSHNVSKGIDRRGGESVGWFGPWLRKWRKDCGITQKQIAALFPSKNGGLTGCVANWELGLNMPTPEQFNLICSTFDFPFESLEEAEREIVGMGVSGTTAIWSDGGMGDFDITAPATDAAKQWEGWGSALKPAQEPIAFARKPLSEGTIAANVLEHGTGAINVDACRVESGQRPQRILDPKASANGAVYAGRQQAGTGFDGGSKAVGDFDLGRWPGNVMHDGSDEVVSGFPRTKSGKDAVKRASGSDVSGNTSAAYGAESRPAGTVIRCIGDEGSASRFFYCAKTSRRERDFGMDGCDEKPLLWSSGTQNPGSFQAEGIKKSARNNHPTVKPIDLMRWLCRLVTPPRGIVLDPFMGSGTTGIACVREGFQFIGIEQSEDYFEIAVKRIRAAVEEQGRAQLMPKVQPMPDAKLKLKWQKGCFVPHNEKEPDQFITVWGYVYGPFAVHKDGRRWAISHRATGWGVAIKNRDFKNLSAAKTCAEAIVHMLNWDLGLNDLNALIRVEGEPVYNEIMAHVNRDRT